MELRKITELKKHPNNPRKIDKSDLEVLIKSIEDNPNYFKARPIILSNRTGEMIIIAGNQRYEAAKKLKMKDVPTFLMENLTEDKEKEIMIRDNVSNGAWDLELLKADWNLPDLTYWGVDIPSEWLVKPGDYSDSFSVPSGAKSPFQQITFTLSDEQVEFIKEMIKKVKSKYE